jgi:hypothetical protein
MCYGGSGFIPALTTTIRRTTCPKAFRHSCILYAKKGCPARFRYVQNRRAEIKYFILAAPTTSRLHFWADAAGIQDSRSRISPFVNSHGTMRYVAAKIIKALYYSSFRTPVLYSITVCIENCRPTYYPLILLWIGISLTTSDLSISFICLINNVPRFVVIYSVEVETLCSSPLNQSSAIGLTSDRWVFRFSWRWNCRC